MLERKLISVDPRELQASKNNNESMLSGLGYSDKVLEGYRSRLNSGTLPQVIDNFSYFLGTSGTLVSTLSPNFSQFEPVVNYSLHLSSYLAREQLGLKGNSEDGKVLEMDTSSYQTLVPWFINYQSSLIKKNRREDPLKIHKHFLDKVFDATVLNSKKDSFQRFNEEFSNFTIEILGNKYEGYLKQSNQKLESKENNSPSNALYTFDDIVGYEKIISVFTDLVKTCTIRDVNAESGFPTPPHFFLYGPPGTGKTMLVHAFANAVKLPFYDMNIASTIDCYHGESEKKIDQFLNQKGVLLMDEFDTFGKNKSKTSDNTLSVNITNTIATNLSIAYKERIVFAITNNIDLVDPKLKSRRLSGLYHIDFPTEADCAKIFYKKLKDGSERSAGYVYTNVDVDEIAKVMHQKRNESSNRLNVNVGFAGSDIESIIQNLIQDRARGLHHGKKLIAPTTKDYIAAVKEWDLEIRGT